VWCYTPPPIFFSSLLSFLQTFNIYLDCCVELTNISLKRHTCAKTLRNKISDKLMWLDQFLYLLDINPWNVCLLVLTFSLNENHGFNGNPQYLKGRFRSDWMWTSKCVNLPDSTSFFRKVFFSPKLHPTTARLCGLFSYGRSYCPWYWMTSGISHKFQAWSLDVW